MHQLLPKHLVNVTPNRGKIQLRIRAKHSQNLEKEKYFNKNSLQQSNFGEHTHWSKATNDNILYLKNKERVHGFKVRIVKVKS